MKVILKILGTDYGQKKTGCGSGAYYWPILKAKIINGDSNESQDCSIHFPRSHGHFSMSSAQANEILESLKNADEISVEIA